MKKLAERSGLMDVSEVVKPGAGGPSEVENNTVDPSSEAGVAKLAPEGFVDHREPARSSGKITGIEVIRLISVCAIVWFHTHARGYEYAYAGLPAVLIISVALPVLHDGDEPLGRLISRRAGRMLKPWLFWSAFYSLMPTLRAIRHGEPPFRDFSPMMLLGGTATHLWYLPFALIASTLGVLLFRWSRRWDDRLVQLACLLMLVLSVLWSSRPDWLPYPLAQWKFAACSIPIGLAIGLSMRRDRGRVGWLIAIPVTVALVSLGLVGPDALPYILGTALACIGFAWMPRLDGAGSRLVGLALGIYILHPFVYSEVVYRVGLGDRHRVAGALLGIAVSALLTLLLRSTPVRRFLV